VLRSGAPIPSLDGATRWIHGEVGADALRGKPTLVEFWALSCHICKENMPTLKRLKETYRPQGVNFVSIHMPRQEEDTKIEDVEAAIEQYGIDEPVAIDNDHTIGDRFETSGLWPHYFLFDAEGKLRGRAAGAAGLGTIESALERLVRAPAA